jgi:hypothetical protein
MLLLYLNTIYFKYIALSQYLAKYDQNASYF